MSAFYKHAASILEKAQERSSSLKALVLSAPIDSKSQLMATVCQVLQYREVLEEILEKSQLLKSERKQYPLRDSIMRHKTRLQAELTKIKVKRRVRDNRDLIPEKIRKTLEQAALIPRYVRINRNKMGIEEAIQYFIQTDKYRQLTRGEFPTHKNTFALDAHMSDLLLFPPGTDFHAHPLYKNGSLILQDKASCIPAYVLNPPPNSICIDACAAPGNKTSHLSSILGNTGEIFAFDMDQHRLNTLKRLTTRAGCTNIIPRCTSFLKVDPKAVEYKDVEYLLLDPSCSGSGIINRLDVLVDDIENESSTLTEDADSKDRLKSLAEFQISIIEHAMQFPSAKRISYSTCSIHEEENEQVVYEILAKHPDWKLAPALESWPRRGLYPVQTTATQSEAQAACMLRCHPDDRTNGFFVVVFEKRAE